MKNIIVATLLLASACAFAQTNNPLADKLSDRQAALFTEVDTNGAPPAPDRTLYDFTLGAGGSVTPKTGQADSSLSLSLSANLFKRCRQLWVEYTQGLAWKPFSGSTDVDVEWQVTLRKDTIYFLPCWSGGAAYGSGGPVWRTGPMAMLQYFTSEKAFLYAQANYDFNMRCDDGVRWGVGIGLEFN